MTSERRMVSGSYQETERILELDASGAALKHIANELGIPLSRVHKVVNTSTTRDHYYIRAGVMP